VSGIRLASLPLDHFTAEVAAFPLASMASFRRAIIELDPALTAGRPDPQPPRRDSTNPLWREAESQILGSFPAFSVDEAVCIRDQLWFGTVGGIGPHQPISLARYVRTLAQTFLKVDAGVARPRLAGDGTAYAPIAGAPQSPDAYARRTWRWLSFAMSPEMLLAALADPTDEPPARIDLLAPGLDRHLRERGYAETHLHIGAALDFPDLWVSAMHAVSRPQSLPHLLRSPGAVFDEGRELAPWLLRVALLRVVLGGFLAWRVGAGAAADLRRYLSRVVLPRLSRDSIVTAAILRLMIRETIAARFLDGRPTYADVANTLRVLVELEGSASAPSSFEEQDPLYRFFPRSSTSRRASQHHPSLEIRFLHQALGYLNASAADRLFARLFWQTARLRNIFYRHVVQRPMTPGLLWFVRCFRRLSPARRLLNSRRLETAARIGGMGHGLRSLEVRTSPEASNGEMFNLISDMEGAAQRLPGQSSGRVPEIGVVLHLTKDRGGGSGEGVPQAHGRNSNGDPRHSAWGYRYAQFYEQKAAEASALAWALRRYPLALRTVRGVDVCTDELGVPGWVMAPLLEHVRAAGRAAASELRRSTGVVLPPLRTTIHAGEEFVHLLGGLRRVDETLTFLGIREGDRIGHGIALGTDARAWAAAAGRLPLAREERLFDLVWEWSFNAQSGGSFPVERAVYLQQEIARLSDLIFGSERTTRQIQQLVIDLHNPAALQEAGFPRGQRVLAQRSAMTQARRNLLKHYLTSSEVFDRGQTLEWIAPAAEANVLEILQQHLRRKVSANGITIEINPTSNLLVGNLADLEHHPLWRLSSPLPGTDGAGLRVSIGSDDPMTFATNLREEYQLLFDTLVLAGLGHDGARSWIDRARTAGMESRFTLPAINWLPVLERCTLPGQNPPLVP
jgi:hypothetical protein